MIGLMNQNKIFTTDRCWFNATTIVYNFHQKGPLRNTKGLLIHLQTVIEKSTKVPLDEAKIHANACQIID